MGVRTFMTPNKGMILIRILYFSWMIGEWILNEIYVAWSRWDLFLLGQCVISPYLTLQALGLGLSYEDISIIYGISPVIALASAPIAGEYFLLNFWASKQVYILS